MKTDRAGLPTPDLEVATRSVGRELSGGHRGFQSWPWQARWWDEAMMAWVMAHESLRTQLFRFVDVLPMLDDHDHVAEHLREHLGEVRSVPWSIRVVQGMLGRGPGIARRLLARQARWSTGRLARRFIAGARTEEVFTAATRLRRRGLACTLDLLGEEVIGDREADAYRQAYEDLIGELAGRVAGWEPQPRLDTDSRGAIPRLSVSLKLSSLSGRFRPIDREGTTADVLGRLRPLLRCARAAGAQVYIDMEQYAVKDLVLSILKTVLLEDEFHDWGEVGVALQAYLPDADRDLEDLLDWSRRRGTPLWVRLVKGAYWDYETIRAAASGWPLPVYTAKWQSDAAFERLAERLMQHAEWLRPALGSHNLRSLARGIACARHYDVADGDWEVQVLYGMADELADRLARGGCRVRVYAPFGEWLPGMAYLVRRLLENTSNESFLRAAAGRGQKTEELLMAPSETATASAAPVPTSDDRFQNEPLADFSRDDVRSAFRDGLATVAGRLGEETPLVIDGASVEGSGTLASEDPSRAGRVVGRVAMASSGDAEAAVAAARRALVEWSSTSTSHRSDCLRRAAELMRRQRWELAAWTVYECGKPWSDADADVAEAIDFCEYYAAQADRLADPLNLDVPGETNRYAYRPRGVVAVISPWNFPLAIPCGMVTAALVTGNTVVLKPAEQSAVTAWRLIEILHAAGVPGGAVNLLPGIGEEIGPVLVEHPDVALVAFTGSREVGLGINRQAARVADNQRHVRRVIAEMGGKNAIIIDDDADLDQAVGGVVESAFGYAGQKCSACSRAIVLERVHEAFVERLIDAAGSLVVGPAEDAATVVGPVIDANARERIEAVIEAGRRTASVALEVNVEGLAGQGHFVGPHIFVDVDPGDPLARDEIFGPVLAVIKVADLDQAFAVANDTDYALTGGVYSRSPRHLKRSRVEFDVGNLYLNRPITGALVGRHPFGGFRLSGIGSKAGGPDYLGQFVVPVCVTENTMRQGFSTGEEQATALER